MDKKIKLILKIRDVISWTRYGGGVWKKSVRISRASEITEGIEALN